MVDELVEFGLFWDGTGLCVLGCHHSSVSLVERIFAIILSIFRFKKFTDSRWLTIGGSSRTLLAALVVGLHPLVQFIRWEGQRKRLLPEWLSKIVR